jgi:hypothetical protein
VFLIGVAVRLGRRRHGALLRLLGKSGAKGRIFEKSHRKLPLPQVGVHDFDQLLGTLGTIAVGIVSRIGHMEADVVLERSRP